MGQTKRLLELGEQMDLARGVNCLVSNSRVSATDWSGNHHIQKARRQEHRKHAGRNSRSAGAAPRRCTATIEALRYAIVPAVPCGRDRLQPLSQLG